MENFKKLLRALLLLSFPVWGNMIFFYLGMLFQTMLIIYIGLLLTPISLMPIIESKMQCFAKGVILIIYSGIVFLLLAFAVGAAQNSID
ncbi:MAG: hypothetical protein ACRCXK_05040 [Wohlfahrtiimonas sp.]